MKKLSNEEVKDARAALGLTQQQLADALLLESKFSMDTVRAWERGVRQIPGPESVAIQLMLELHHLKSKRRKAK